ncbi:helix-turn-helix domain-containing protein [Corynebacterium suicordis]|uniref:Helix-turn-helix domain-containing protein n=1 Tax=Corynebacterium suicordis DSM 45110 TaxID=1121369 RepID=A0ABR9ZH55_9CORY|nr:helix-turn-helix domain-containing protein [Corynebacterium suicordis]MBF4552727.1 helix-turn-helix domain-containing protein [Corynebacterium suicordis DSM 45110]MDR6278314.1 hypothetical protein [Corynebacterium suicordis]
MSIEAREWVECIAPSPDGTTEFAVLSILAGFADKFGDRAYPSAQTIAERLRGDERVTFDSGDKAQERKYRAALRLVQRALDYLEDGGWIHRSGWKKGRQGSTVIWHLNYQMCRKRPLLPTVDIPFIFTTSKGIDWNFAQVPGFKQGEYRPEPVQVVDKPPDCDTGVTPIKAA